MSASLAQLTTLRSQHAEALLEYLSWVAGALESAEKLPAYMGSTSLDELYIDPDVLKIERVTVADQGKEAGERTREERDASAPHQEQLAAEARDIGEGQRRLREEEREVRIAWAAERDRLGFGTGGRAVIIGPPGQGKTLLARMSACQIAAGSLRILESRRALANEVALPVVVSLDALVRALPEGSRPPEEALLHALRVALHESGCPARAVPHVLARVRTEHAWLLLDALDEVEKVGELPRVFVPLAEWQSRVVITSRPYGYAAQRLPFPVTEYRLAPFTPMQAEAFIERWGGDVERQARLTDLLGRSPAIAGLSQTPFLLTLLAWAGQRHEIAADTTRTRLYERIVRDLLGLIDDHSGLVDEERADSWIRLLMDLFRQHFDPASQQVAFSATGLVDTIAAHSQRPPVLGVSAVQASNLSAAEKAHYLLEELVEKRLLYPTSPARDVYSVAHKSIAEFMLGCALADLSDADGGKGWQQIEKYIDHKAWLPQWAETIQFMAGQMEDPRPLVDLLRNRRKDDAFRHRLALAGHCIAEIASERGDCVPVEKIGTQLLELYIEHGGIWSSCAHLRLSLQTTLQVAASTRRGAKVMKRLLAITSARSASILLHMVAVEALRGVAWHPEVLARLLAIADDSVAAVRALQRAASIPNVAALLIKVLHGGPEHLSLTASKVLESVASEEVLARLIELIQKEPSFFMLRDALLSRLASAEMSPKVAAPLIDLTRSRFDWLLRASAISALGSLSAVPEVAARLLELTHDEYPQAWGLAGIEGLQRAATRPEVIAAFEEMRVRPASSSTEIATRLFELVHDEKEHVREVVVQALLEIAEHPNDLLRETHLEVGEDEYSWDYFRAGPFALESVARGGNTAKVLLEHTRKLYWKIRLAAINALKAGAERPEVVARLFELTQSTDEELALAAVKSLRGRTGPQFAAQLIELTTSSNYKVALAALESLKGEAGRPEVAALLIKLTQHKYFEVRKIAVTALTGGAERPEVAARLLELIRYPGYEMEGRLAAKALQYAAERPEIATELTKYTRDDNLHVQEAAAVALTKAAANPDVATRLIEMMLEMTDDSQSKVREAAILALRSATASPYLTGRLFELIRNPSMDCAAASCLAAQMAQGIRVFIDWWGWRVRVRDVESLSRSD